MRHPSKQQTSQHVSNATCDASKGSASNQVKKKSPGFECGLCVCVGGEPRTHTSTGFFSNISGEFQPRETCLNFPDPQCCSWSHKDLHARLGSLWHPKSATCTLHTTRSSKGISHCKAGYLHSVHQYNIQLHCTREMLSLYWRNQRHHHPFRRPNTWCSPHAAPGHKPLGF